jgi:hypothetical protein
MNDAIKSIESEKRLEAGWQDRSAVVGWLATCFGPPILAGFVVSNEAPLTALSRTHEAMLPLAVMLLMAALLQQRLRQFLVVTLCYGVAFLAIRDTSRVTQIPLPPALNYDWVDALRPVGLWLVAALAVISAVAESIKPGAVWARRCYFGASGLYFAGVGLINYAANHSWRGIVLCVTGGMAFLGCLFAQQIVADEAVASDEEELSDELAQQAREASHRAALQTKEWRDNLIAIIEERDGPATNGAVELPHTL